MQLRSELHEVATTFWVISVISQFIGARLKHTVSYTHNPNCTLLSSRLQADKVKPASCATHVPPNSDMMTSVEVQNQVLKTCGNFLS